MSVQKVDVAQLHEVEQALGELATYCSNLQVQARAASGAVVSEWSGPAATEFLSQVAIWEAGAEVLRAGAEDLRAWAGGAAGGYDSAHSQAKTGWAV